MMTLLSAYYYLSIILVVLVYSVPSYSDGFTPLYFNGYKATAQSGDAGRVILQNSGQNSCLIENSFQSGSFMLLDRPSSANFVECNDVSSNGFVAGTFTEISPFIREAAVFTTTSTIELGFLSVPADPDDSESSAHGVSDDGSVVVGESVTDQVAGGTEVNEAFMWTLQTGMVGLGHLDTLPGSPKRSVARGISSDGNFIVGHSYWVGGGPNDDRAFVWTASDGMVGLPITTSGTESFALEVSDDGSVVVGQTGSRAVKWVYSPVTEFYLGMELGFGGQTDATAVSEDGTVVGGRNGFGASIFIHTDDEGVINVLSHLNSLPNPLAVGWQLNTLTGISYDGMTATLTGGGENPSGLDQAWRATIDLPIINVVLGDVNLDGNVTQGDLILFNRFLLGIINLDNQQRANADVSNNDVADLGDLIVLERMLLGL